jgi:hypothetical protein
MVALNSNCGVFRGVAGYSIKEWLHRFSSVHFLFRNYSYKRPHMGGMVGCLLVEIYCTKFVDFMKASGQPKN